MFNLDIKGDSKSASDTDIAYKYSLMMYSKKVFEDYHLHKISNKREFERKLDNGIQDLKEKIRLKTKELRDLVNKSV